MGREHQRATRDPQSLLPPESLRDRCRLLRVIDSIVAPDDPSFEYHPRWRRGEQMAKLSNGEGDFVIIWFSPRGTVVRGFDHDSQMSPFRTEDERPWRGLYEGFPKALAYALDEPAFAVEETTFCLWHTARGQWTVGDIAYPRGAGSDPDGSKRLLAMFGRSFGRWAAEYYGRKFDTRAIGHLRRGGAVGTRTIEALANQASFETISAAVEETGWATAEGLLVAERGSASTGTKGQRLPKHRPRKRRRSFGGAEFTVRAERTAVSMLIHGDEVVASAEADIYADLFDLVRKRIAAASRANK